MRVRHIPALEDNYMYLLIDDATNQAAAVDPVEPDKIIKAVKEENINLTTVLITHHHWDHAGGNKELISKVGGLTVYGGDDRIDGLTKKVSHNFQFKLGSLSINCLFTPCHTSGHICYFVESSNEAPVVFTGDTLFIAGCGKFFEGSPDQMYRALVEILGSLPPQTEVFCGHEYTVSNLKFAEFADRGNNDVISKLTWAKEQRERGKVTIPSTIADELKFNPFMRVNEPSMQTRCGTSTGAETMGYLRREKDNFKPRG